MTKSSQAPSVEMVERVARAIYEEAPLMGGSNIPHKPHGETYAWDEWKAVAAAPMLEMAYREARAAIAALRRPTEAMVAAAYAKECAIFGQYPRANMNISTAWEVMIDAALSPPDIGSTPGETSDG